MSYIEHGFAALGFVYLVSLLYEVWKQETLGKSHCPTCGHDTSLPP